MLPQATPPTTSLRFQSHKRSFSSSSLPDSAAAHAPSTSLSLSISANGKASLERKYRPFPQSISPPYASSAATAATIRNRARSVSLATLASSVGPKTSTGLSWPSGPRGLPMSFSPTDDTTTPPESDSTSPATALASGVAPQALGSGVNLLDASTDADAPNLSEPESPDVARILLQTFTNASPSPARKKIRRSQSLAELSSASAMPLGDAIGANFNRKSSMNAPREPPPILKFAKRSLSGGRGALAMKASSAKPKDDFYPIAKPAIRTTPVPPPHPSTLFPPNAPPPDPAALLRSLKTLLASHHLLSSGWMPTLSALVSEGENALEGHVRGPSKIATLLKAAEDAEREGRLTKEKPASKRRGKSSAMHPVQQWEAAQLGPPVMPASAHPPYPSTQFTWIAETGLEEMCEGDIVEEV